VEEREVEARQRRPLLSRQKRLIIEAKETYYRGREGSRLIVAYAHTSTIEAKETHYRGKRDLL
jgi:hypothetical protein